MRLSRLLFGIFLSIPLLFPFDTALYQTVDKTEAAQTEQERTIRMGRATWDTGWFQGEVFKQLFEALGYTVVGPDTYDNDDFYQAVAQGDVDLWVNGWFPLHDPFIKAEQIQDQVEVLGFEVKAGALQGYLIDKNTAEQYNIQSLADLQKPEVAQLFDSDGNGQADLIGCNPGWGCEPIIEHHLDVYQLRQTVEHVQGDYSPLMGETVERYQQGEPVLFYTWTPNWTVGALVPGQDVVWLEVPFPSLPDAETDLEAQTTVANLPGCVADPCQVGFPPNDIRAVANINFLTANPAVRHILETVVLPLEDISAQNALLLEGEDDENDIRRHATEWIDNNREIVDRWLAAAREIQGDNQGLVSPDATGSNETQSGTGEVLRVATKTVPPFVIYKDRQYTGFSIELWDEIADELDVSYELYGVNSVAKLLDEAERGVADVATAGIGITSQREEDLDFSHSFFDSGLQIMVSDDANSFIPIILSTIFSPQLLYIIGFLLVMLLVSAHIIWFFERDQNPDFPSPYLEGIWEAFWWAAVTATTVGYGDKTPKGTLGRIFGLFWMFAGLFILAYFTAGVTSTVTLQELRGSINGPEDLSGKIVATVEKSAAAEYLMRQGIDPVEFTNEEAAYRALEQGEVQAIVYDAPVLQHYASHTGKGKVKVVGLVFEELSYGIAFQHDSPYREEINLALLKLVENGTYDDIHDRWFGAEPAP